MKLKIVSLSLLILLHYTVVAQAPRSYTSSEILLQLKKLNTVGSVLYIAAHPDDENTRLIAYLANEKCLRTGYLSLTRGDGGQNLIGPEQGIELGVIRTQELLAARRIDGGEQFFTRAYDFGYSKTPKETFEKWNHDSVLSDVVWVIRNFRPDIIITRFAPDGSGGHGHHTASAILAEEAFDAAADPKRFPEQLQYVDVWQTRRMFYNSGARFWNPSADLSGLLKTDVGVYNPLLGKSYGEMAAESRSMHKSQGFGSAKQRGEMFEYFKPVKGDTANLKDIFDGIDFSWKRIQGGGKVGKQLDLAISNFDFYNTEKSATNLILAKKELVQLPQSDKELSYVLNLINESIVNCSKVFVEAVSKSDNISQGEYDYKLLAINRGGSAAKVSSKMKVSGRDLPSDFLFFGDLVNVSLQPNKLDTTQNRYNQYEENSQPYWLKNPLSRNLFSLKKMEDIGKAEISYFNVGLNVIIDTHTVRLTRKVQYKWVDPEKGELYRPLVITPPVMVNVVNEVVAFGSNEAKEVKLVLKAGKDSISGNLKLTLPADWKAEPASIAFLLNKKGEEKIVSFKITPPNGKNETTIKAVADMNGELYSKGIKEIKYDHIPVQTLFPEAEMKLIRLDVKSKLKHIGYIPGAGDEVAPCLSQLGYEVVTLTDDMLAKENLTRYEAIVTGVRAYNTNDKLPTFKQKLMDYVSNGGNLVVQYNTNSWAGPLSSDIGPYKFKITRDRVTDENAKVNFDMPDHPVLNTPNKITSADFEGWIQERCIYSAGEVDSHYEMPLSMSDPDEKPNKGSLIIAKHGKGNFIYTGLVFFRELPAGVPGAYRLFVNLVELGK